MFDDIGLNRTKVGLKYYEQEDLIEYMAKFKSD